MSENAFEPFEQPITDRLNLNAFQPDEVEFLVQDYLAECRKQGIKEVHLVHERDTIGHLLSNIHEILERLPGVVEYRLAGKGGDDWWNETVVILEPET